MLILQVHECSRLKRFLQCQGLCRQSVRIWQQIGSHFNKIELWLDIPFELLSKFILHLNDALLFLNLKCMLFDMER